MRKMLVLGVIAACASAIAWIVVRPSEDPPPASTDAAPAPSAAPRPAVSAAATTAPTPSPAPARQATTPTGSAASPEPPTPAPGPAAQSSGMVTLRALEERFAAFEALTYDPEVPDDATPEEEDRLLSARFREVADEAALLEEAYQDVIASHDDPRAAVLAQIAIGDLKDALRVDLENAPAPSYFNPKQLALYRMGLEDKAYAQASAAQEEWDRAAELARGLGPDPEIEALLAERRPSEE